MEGERRIRGAVHRVGCWCCIKPRLHFRPSIRELRSFSYGSLRAVPFPGIVFSIILISYSIIIPANSTEINPSDVYSLSRWFIYFSFFSSLSFFSFFFFTQAFSVQRIWMKPAAEDLERFEGNNSISRIRWTSITAHVKKKEWNFARLVRLNWNKIQFWNVAALLTRMFLFCGINYKFILKWKCTRR